MPITLQNIQFTWPGRRVDLPVVTLRWSDTDTIRCNGTVSCPHTMAILPTREYDEGIIELLDAAKALIKDAYEDFQSSEAFLKPTEENLEFGKPLE